jgi:hypothetical protein
MIETIARAVEANKLTKVTCFDRITHEEVEILCVEIPGGLKPIARIYPDADFAMADVTTPGGHHGKQLLQ